MHVEMSDAIERDEVPVDYRCQSCGRSLGERLYSTPLFPESEIERLRADLSPWGILNFFLPDRHGNATREYGQTRPRPHSAPPLGIKTARGPRSGGRVWLAQKSSDGVLVHFKCKCRRDSRLLADILAATQEALDVEPPSPPKLVVRI